MKTRMRQLMLVLMALSSLAWFSLACAVPASAQTLIKMPDLTIQMVQDESGVKQLILINQGQATAVNFTVRIKHNEPEYPMTYWFQFRSLKPGQTYRLGPISNYYSLGATCMAARADVDNTVLEWNESNNVFIAPWDDPSNDCYGW